MKFWDASAVVPVLVGETTTRSMQSPAASDPDMLVWWGTEVECASVLARLEREGALDSKGTRTSFARLSQLSEGWHEIEPGELVREAAKRFLRVLAPRAADAWQLAAEFVAAESRPGTLRFVTLDDRLADAAAKEGFVLVGAS